MLVNWHKALGLATFAALVGAGFAARAGSAQLQVTATLPDSCTVGGATLAFGAIDPSQNTPAPKTTTFNVQCSTIGNVTVALDGGLHHGLGNNGRAMKRTTSNDYLDYSLKTSTSQDWPVGSGITFPVVVGPNPIAVQGIVAVQTKPGGDYADTVQITTTVN